MATTILIVDDEEDIRTFLDFNLKHAGYNTINAADGKEAIEKIKKHKPDLVLLDIMLPEIDGLELCKLIKNTSGLSETIIIALTALTQDEVQINALEYGCDDFVNKPIKLKVLLARIQNKLKKKTNEVTTSLFTLDLDNLIIKFPNGKTIQLPKKEFELLLLLLKNKNKVIKREDIFQKIWGKEEIIVSDRTIDVYVRKLRQKIGESHIKTVKGVGYKFEE